MNFNQFILPIIYILIAILGILILLIVLERKALKGRLVRALNMRLFLVTVPKEVSES